MENSEEVWVDIPDYEGLYMVSDLGRVKSLPKSVSDPSGRVRNYRERILKQQPVGKYGHLKVGLYKNGSCKEFLVHRLVLISFIGEAERGEEGLHKDGVPSNNCLGNLRWGSSKENSEDSIKHGTIARGKKLPQTVLTEDDVRAIRKDHRTSTVIAPEYGVTARHIRAIKSNRYWVYLDKETR